MAPTIKNLRRKYPQAEIIFQHRRIPNAVNMYDRLRNDKLVKSHGNHCMPADNEATLLDAIKVMCGDQFPPDISLPLYNWIAIKPVDIPPQTTEPSPSASLATSPPYLPPSYHVCTQCNKIEPSMLHLYIHGKKL